MGYDNQSIVPAPTDGPKAIWLAMRLYAGWLMLWPFIDKVFGLGFNTCVDPRTKQFLGVMCQKGAWLAGGSPTFGYLKFGTSGPLAPIYQAMAGSAIVDWLFMLGLLLVGLSMILGIGVRIAGYSGALMVFMMYLANLPPLHNPIMDEHIAYLLIFLGLASVRAGRFCSIGRWWAGTSLVKRFPILE